MIQPASDLFAAYRDVLTRNPGPISAFRTKGKIRPRRVRGIVRASRELGVSRQHLYDVIHGFRRSARIEAWVARNLKEES